MLSLVVLKVPAVPKKMVPAADFGTCCMGRTQRPVQVQLRRIHERINHLDVSVRLCEIQFSTI